MRWRPPSERLQMILLLPILVPLTIAAAPVLVVMLPPVWLVDKIGQWVRARNARNPVQRWFAWRPVRFSGFWEDVPDQWLWLETVEARWKRTEWEYRPLGFVSRYDATPTDQVKDGKGGGA